MKRIPQLLYKPIENKTIVWLESRNQYLILEPFTAKILSELSNGSDKKQLAKTISSKLKVPITESKLFIQDLQHTFLSDTIYKSKTQETYPIINTPKVFQYSKYYKINTHIFKVNFLSDYELSLVHPKFAHLEIITENFDTLFNVYYKDEFIYLSENDTIINAWKKEESHFFQGKFSMKLIQKIHQKEEQEWMGVFHASAVSNTKKCILILGDSGNGKSTSLALLQAHGFTCIADDFSPISAQKKEVFSFPAAISIKQSAYEMLAALYPDLKNKNEYHFPKQNKIVRYLPPNNTNFSTHLPCEDLLFIKYEKGAKTSFQKISKLKAFQHLVLDSWISPMAANAQQFLDWFSSLNNYQLTYSNNNEMIEKVSKTFNNDL